ncbi:uncharacterized protein LOC141604722 [Silene latifolia]|uniref:uncharacterized protein LOC141604722 n=1 Tax=Silene latifolia TaxID=37657 RepID=UPI003D7817C1
MALEVQLPPLLDFDFNTGRESPSVETRPSTPKRFGEVYFSAPSSPARGFGVYGGFDGELSFSNYERGDVSTSSSPLCWDRSSWFFPSPNRAIDRIKTMETIRSPFLSPETPSSNNSRRKKSFWSTFSPKRRKDNKLNPFQALDKGETKTEKVRGRGRERESDVPASRSGRRVTRSLSPLRVSKYPWEEHQEEERGAQNTNQSSSNTKPPLSAKGSRKWRLKDFLLFRSASEGHTTEKDPFRKYAEMYRKHHVVKSPAPKSADGSPIVPAPRKGQISAHELHYTVNKAISQDMKKKTFLPYKQGILGRLAVNPAVHALAYGYGSVPNTYG